VLDRRTGEPIVPAPEKPVPQGAAPGDEISPTQPFSELSFQPATLSEKDMWGVTPIDHLWCRNQFRQYRYQGIFTPQTHEGRGSLIYPGHYGVFNWGGVAVDEQRQIMIVNPSKPPALGQGVWKEIACHERAEHTRGETVQQRGRSFNAASAGAFGFAA
jgi:quinoprotein glucose dehydrogenase